MKICEDHDGYYIYDRKHYCEFCETVSEVELLKREVEELKRQIKLLEDIDEPM